ncbi:peptidase M24 [Pirellula staleyi DSM 6068]|uniref:Peptidase M24 n=1 Tax=Pirellula staleyi (strain ATCC 27377 / DSM 6068 / ICPB 4128) TaxID=530564 RepID=D2R638_PIRSD|nr:Xaa-Pro peptidase family protein [Pirellula staleyi]ADB19123.1 peptidase M24 [Pirellula staleyi DSM 6068]
MPDFALRRDKLRSLVKKSGLHALLVTNFTNVSYLTGFTGDDSYLLLSQHGEVIISDPRYTEQLDDECPGLVQVIRRPPTKMSDAVSAVLKSTGVQQVAIEAASMTVAFRDTLAAGLGDVQLHSSNGLVEQLREIKDKEEIDAIRAAIKCAQQAFGVIRASLRPEQSEKQVADELEYQIRLFGGKKTSFEPIIGVGPRGALPHGRPSDKKVGEDDFILIDWGARMGGYISDLTRVLVTGKISPKLERIYGVVLAAQLAAIAEIKPGAVMKDVDAAARGVIEKAGFGPKFGHSLGHGIGMEVHEAPRLAADQDRPLRPGMVVTVEPGIYLPGWGGVRIEDDVLVTKSGHEVLSSTPKQLQDCIVTA